MTSLTYRFKHPLPNTDAYVNELMTVPGVTGVSWEAQPDLIVIVEDSDELNGDALARYLGYDDFTHFVGSCDEIVNETELLERETAKYEAGNISSLVDITPDD